MGYFLLDNPVRHGPKWYTTRRAPIRLIVLHVTAGLEQMSQAPDDSAEATARYCANTERTVSWHSGVDWDSTVDLLPPTYTAFHCQGFNSSSLGLEISKRTTDWSDAPDWWVARVLQRAAAKTGGWARANNIPVQRLTLAQAKTDGAGFLYHATADPQRRSDPGENFPWERFADLVRQHINPSIPQEDDMAVLVKQQGKPEVWHVADARTLVHVIDGTVAEVLTGDPNWRDKVRELPATHKLFTDKRIKRVGPN